MYKIFVLAFCLIVCTTNSFCQYRIDNTPLDKDYLLFSAIEQDVFLQQDNYSFSLTKTDSLTKAKLQIKRNHSAKKAALLSTFLPGAGQVYNKQVWKVPIIGLAAAGVIYFAIYNGNNMNKFKDEYNNRLAGRTDRLLADYSSYSNYGIYNLYNSYKSNFQLSIIVGGLFYLANILDAYVSGHLFSFDISDDISMNLYPSRSNDLLTNSPSLDFSIGFKF